MTDTAVIPLCQPGDTVTLLDNEKGVLFQVDVYRSERLSIAALSIMLDYEQATQVRDWLNDWLGRGPSDTLDIWPEERR